MVDTEGKIRPDCFGSLNRRTQCKVKCSGCECFDECAKEYETQHNIGKHIKWKQSEKRLPKSLNDVEEDVVNHPSHYRQHKFESIDEMVICFGIKAVYDFCICNAWKYRNRAPYKNNFEEDNAKADWYLTKAKELKEEMED